MNKKPHYSNIHNRFTLNGNHYDKDSLFEVAYSYIKEGLPYEKELGMFLLNWLDDNDFIVTQTSGTTGRSKNIKISKQAMVNSAIATGDFFKLEPGNTALHCIPTKFIAGKMMLVRAFILGLEIDIVSPHGNPIKNTKKHYDFTAMVPLQVEKALKNIDQIKILLIGGAKPPTALLEQLKGRKVKVYETYGMTETITHIAAKTLNEEFFKSLPGVTFSVDERGCLQITSKRISAEPIITNDLVELKNNKSFKWVGRVDNLINSGGVKLFPEQIEDKLQDKIQQRFFIASKPDEKLGEAVILVLESDNNTIDNEVFSLLEPYEKPKAVYNISKFEETPTGKIKRNEIIKKLEI